VAALRCHIVCGSANNQLAHDGVAGLLAARGILYAPDFIVNAGGLINVSLELGGYDDGEALRRCGEIKAVLSRVFAHAEAAGVTPLHAAVELAQRRLAAVDHGDVRPAVAPDARAA
jgi:glutamate dehydrogenase/leucine dehydrogenase